METFLDGGVIEILIAILFANLFNYIFKKKVALILFSLLIVSGPAILFFIKKGELYYWLLALCVLNSLLLVALLWKEKKAHPHEALFRTEGMKNKLSKFKVRIHTFFQNKTS